MKKILGLLGAITISGTIVSNVVACLPAKSNDSSIIGDKLDLGLFEFSKIEDRFRLKKDNVIVNDEINLIAGITKGIQNLTTTSLPWHEVDIDVQTSDSNINFRQVYLKMEAQKDAKSVKGSVKWGDLETKPNKTYVDLRPVLKDWLSATSPKLVAQNAEELDVKATLALGGVAFKQNNLAGLGLQGKYDAGQKIYTVSVISGESQFFQTSEVVFKVEMQ